MRRFLDTRLVRIAKTEAPRDLMEARHRSLLRGRAALSALLCERSTPPYDGRACAAALQLGETAAGELAGIPDTPELRERDAARLARDHAGAEETFEADCGTRCDTTATAASQTRPMPHRPNCSRHMSRPPP